MREHGNGLTGISGGEPSQVAPEIHNISTVIGSASCYWMC